MNTKRFKSKEASLVPVVSFTPFSSGKSWYKYMVVLVGSLEQDMLTLLASLYTFRISQVNTDDFIINLLCGLI